jgi:hypothetical protein
MLNLSGFWKEVTEQARHITWKELLTLHLSLTELLLEVLGQHILLCPVVHIVMNSTLRSPMLMSELQQLWAFLMQHNITLLPHYIWSKVQQADSRSHAQITETSTSSLIRNHTS